MKNLLIASVLILGFISCNNKTPEQTNNKIEIRVDKRSYSGQIVEFYQNGSRKFMVNYENGLKDGNYETWFKSGNKKVEGIYKNGKRIGKWNWYDEKGKVYFAIKYENTRLGSL